MGARLGAGRCGADPVLKRTCVFTFGRKGLKIRLLGSRKRKERMRAYLRGLTWREPTPEERAKGILLVRSDR